MQKSQYTIREIADLTGLSEKQVWNYVNNHKLKTAKNGKSAVTVDLGVMLKVILGEDACIKKQIEAEKLTGISIDNSRKELENSNTEKAIREDEAQKLRELMHIHNCSIRGCLQQFVTKYPAEMKPVQEAFDRAIKVTESQVNIVSNEEYTYAGNSRN